MLLRDVVYSGAFLDAFRSQLERWSLDLHDPASGGFRLNSEYGANTLSTADVVWIGYAINATPLPAPVRDSVVCYLQGRQDPLTGEIPPDRSAPVRSGTQGHSFWMVVRALRILGADLLHFPAHLESRLTPTGMDAWFAGLRWDGDAAEMPGHHHQVLGLLPGVLGVGDDALVECLFRNIAKQQNPVTGTWPSARPNISRTFAYTALHLATGRLPNFPERILDEILRLQREPGLWDESLPGYGTMDSCFMLIRLSPRIGGYRRREAVAALRRASQAMRQAWSERQIEILENPHQVGAVAHIFGLLQEALPDEYHSERPFRFDWDKLELYRCPSIASEWARRKRSSD